MSWYNYLFAAIAVLGLVGVFFGGMAQAARMKNGVHMFYALLVLAFWIGIFYWNVFA